MEETWMIPAAQVRAMKRIEIIKLALDKEITWIRASEILGLSTRQLRRLRTLALTKGLNAAVGLKSVRKSHNKTPEEVRLLICSLYESKYMGFNIKHFLEKLNDPEKVKHLPTYPVVVQLLKDAKLIAPKLKRGRKHRSKRERKPQSGMMIFMDGSTHNWFGPDEPKCDLIAVMDDATSEVYFAQFYREENTLSCLHSLLETIKKMGVPASLYVDRATHFFRTKGKNMKVDADAETQVKRALAKLGCILIPSYSPQGRGRMERLWGTWQGRLPQELKLLGIKTMQEGNAYLQSVFIQDSNKKFTILPKESQTAFTKIPEGMNLDIIFSIQTQRLVHKDNTVHFKNDLFQLEKLTAFPQGLEGSKVTVHEIIRGGIIITYGNHLLGQFEKVIPMGLRTDVILPKAFKKAA